MGDSMAGLVPAYSDAAVLERVRGGDVRAYRVLYERYVQAARGVARSLVRNETDADDVVSEVFVSVLSAILRGKGPRDAFAAYLMVSVRNECQRALRTRGRDGPRAESTEALPLEEAGLQDDPFARHDEAEVLQQALRSLPPRSREVLWRAEVEGQSAQEIAAVIGSTAQAVAAQARRARRALGDAYLRGHLAAASGGNSLPPACAETRPHLADLVRDSICARARRRLEDHLSGCPSCRHASAELERLNERLRAGPALPLAVGAGLMRVGLKDRILGWLASSSAPLVAASGVVVSTIVPLDVTPRSSADDRVAEAAAPEVESDDGAPPDADTKSSEAAGAPYAVVSSGWRRFTADDVAATVMTSKGRSKTGTRVDRRDEGKATPPKRPGEAPAPANTPPAAPPPPKPSPPGSAPEAESPAIDVPSSAATPEVGLRDIEVPAITTPAVSLPPATLPQVTVAAVTVPGVTVPAVTVPAPTVPPDTLPEVTVAAVAVPPVSAPPTTVPPVGG